jgi:hypothetical protein
MRFAFFTSLHFTYRLVAKTPDEGLRAVRRPIGGVVELGRVPDDLVEELRDLNGVRRRAGAVALERPARRVRDVAHMIRGVERLAVPAAG